MSVDDSYEDNVRLTLIATGLKQGELNKSMKKQDSEKPQTNGFSFGGMKPKSFFGRK